MHRQIAGALTGRVTFDFAGADSSLPWFVCLVALGIEDTDLDDVAREEQPLLR